jgi:hypothetical protein
MNYSWPNGVRRPLTQSEHEAWNESHYPGTRQLCCECNESTGRCEEDQIICDDCEDGPFCEECYSLHFAQHAKRCVQ